MSDLIWKEAEKRDIPGNLFIPFHFKLTRKGSKTKMRRKHTESFEMVRTLIQI